MIVDFVKKENEQAYFKCTECGAEIMLLHYEFTKDYDFPIINTEKSIENQIAFVTKHKLCKKEFVQTEIFEAQN